ncbi:response regulators consisting of a CheY-like receiver domain and a winged-helix DNA-binding domain [Firmicutes bacterium CAG:313]|jgi:response regulators consisting of a cheY-like receiver domain and a winged-helix DNA-binding domain|nr:response regulators consisting of a CheY-like receiver domain and a winged-helix DNA-binding domain [Firmicutes bacterium CAG:313]
MAKLLIVDDEMHIRDLVQKYATFENYESETAENGLEAIEKVKHNEYDLVIMDIMMPELDGFSAVKEIRKISQVPVIMLSARSEEYDKLYGFDLGIDDYVTKPFSPKELMRRVNAVLARATHKNNQESATTNEVWQYKNLKIDYSAHIVTINNEKIDLTPKEYELLVYLIKNQNIAVRREQLLEKVWGYDYYGDDRTLDTHMKSLRKKIGEYANCIITIRRVGYRFETE